MCYKIKCKVCGATQWVRGYEADTNAGGILDSEVLDCCEHVSGENSVVDVLQRFKLLEDVYEIIDQEYDSNEDDYNIF